MTTKIIIPKWCKRWVNEKEDIDHIDRCCYCNKRGKNIQVGDGKFIHSLCFEHRYFELNKGSVTSAGRQRK